MKSTRATIIGCAFCGYALAISGVIMNYIELHTLETILDAVIIIAACLCIQFLQSRIAAIVLTVYSILNVVLVYIQKGNLVSCVIVALAVFALIATFKFQLAWHKVKIEQAE
jgi:cell shape-determining protein MreD